MEQNAPAEAVQEVETEVPGARKKMPTFLVVLLCIFGGLALISAAFFGALAVFEGVGNEPEAKIFTLAGLTVTLTDEFEVYAERENCAVSADCAFTVMTESFSEIEGLEDMSLAEYLLLVRDCNATNADEPEYAQNGVQYFTFSDGGAGYLVFVFRGANCFYLGQFWCRDGIPAGEQLERLTGFAATAREIQAAG